MIHSAIAALVFGIILFFLIVIGIELSVRSFEKTLTMLGLESPLRFFEKIKGALADRFHTRIRCNKTSRVMKESPA
jgi:hypothetical protein